MRRFLIPVLTLAAAIGMEAVAQPDATSRALGAPAQPKIAPPAPTLTVKAGQGGDRQNRSPELEEAIASCDVKLALSLGATAEDAARALTPGMSDTIVPGSPAWVRTPDGQLRLAFMSNTTQPAGRVYFTGDFGDYAPPGGVASLPTMDEVFPPPPAAPGSIEKYAQVAADMNKIVSTGVTAQAAADYFLTQQRPELARSQGGMMRADPAQASYYEKADGTVGLTIPNFRRSGPSGAIIVDLPGFSAASGLPGMRKPGEAEQLKTPAWAAELVETPPPPPRPTRC